MSSTAFCQEFAHAISAPGQALTQLPRRVSIPGAVVLTDRQSNLCLSGGRRTCRRHLGSVTGRLVVRLRHACSTPVALRRLCVL